MPAATCDQLRVWLAAQKEYRLAQAKAVAGLDEVTRAALEAAEDKAADGRVRLPPLWLISMP